MNLVSRFSAFTALSFALPMILLVGCSTPQSVPLTVENSSSIKNIYIEKNVPKPSAIYWRGTIQLGEVHYLVRLVLLLPPTLV